MHVILDSIRLQTGDRGKYYQRKLVLEENTYFSDKIIVFLILSQ